MKQSYLFFFGGIILIVIGLWDYFALRILPDISADVESQQLVVAIVGALLLVFSPLFEQQAQKWMYTVLLLFLVLTATILLIFALNKPYSDGAYIFRHIFGLLIVLLLILNSIRSLKDGISY